VAVAVAVAVAVGSLVVSAIETNKKRLEISNLLFLNYKNQFIAS